MEASPGDEPHDPADRELRSLLWAGEHQLRVDERRRRHELERQACEASTVRGALSALAAAGTRVAVGTERSTLPPSQIVELGLDYVVLAADGVARLLPVASVASIQAVGRGGEPLADAGVRLDLTERLAELAALRLPVRVDAGAAGASGRLHQAGREVLVLRRDDGVDVVVSNRAVVVIEVPEAPEPVDQSSASPVLSPEPTTSG